MFTPTYITHHVVGDLLLRPRAWREFAVLGCKSERLTILKQQLLIYVLGLGIEKAHHPWSEGKHTFAADELLEWLITTLIPMAKKLERQGQLSTKPKMEGRSLPAGPTLGTVSALGDGSGVSEGEEMDKFSEECHKEYECRVTNGDIDVLSEMQSLITPKTDNTMIGYDLKVWFGHPTNDRYCGKVIGIVNEKTDRSNIAWNTEGLHADDSTEQFNS